MESFEQWSARMQEIYDGFSKGDERVESTISTIPESQGGYLIILRHSQEISEKIARFSERVSLSVPSIKYDAETIHTTISDYSLTSELEPDEEVLRNLSESVISSSRISSRINYLDWRYNTNTVLVEGRPEKQFLDLSKEIRESAQKKGIDLRLPWGAHITTNRFTENLAKAELSDFFRLMQEAPEIGLSVPRYLDVGYFQLNKQGLNITFYERFNLSQ